MPQETGFERFNQVPPLDGSAQPRRSLPRIPDRLAVLVRPGTASLEPMTERGPIDLIEEATRLFRSAGFATMGLYYIGALPFVLGFLFFWTEMSRDAFAYQSILPGSFAVALLYLWMNIWQAIYTAELRTRLGKPTRWTARLILRLAIQQIAVQPTSLIVIPIGALLVLPFAWIYGFYQNFT